MEKTAGWLWQFIILFIGITGMRLAWLCLLQWEQEVNIPVFELEAAVLSLLSILLWGSRKWKITLAKALAAALGYGCYVWYRWEWVRDGMIQGIDTAVQEINRFYGIHLVLPDATQMSGEEIPGVLFVGGMLLSLFLGYGILRRRTGIMAVLYLIPLVASGFVQAFPNNLSLVLMILSLAGMAAYRRFWEKPAAGRKAAIFFMGLSLVVLWTAYYQLLPILDSMYKGALDTRIAVYVAVNEEFLPKVNEALKWKSWFRDGTIKGNLAREEGFFYTSAELFEVTVEKKPEQIIYLKGFVGNTYTGSSWEADEDGRLRDYYSHKGWKIPESYAELVNLTYDVLQTAGQGGQPMEMEVRELGGANAYSLYPYGAYLGAGYTVHADGSVDHTGRTNRYPYYPLWSYDGGADWGQLREEGEEAGRYRQYVYDNYLDYPKDQLPLLTEWLEQEQEEGLSVFETVSGTVTLLGKMARYNLDAGRCPEGEDFVEYFLFEQKEGYCSHFASSAVLMLRRMGIPARYVTGYCVSPGAFQENGQGTYTAVIEDKQAHAWVEIYLDTVGWVPIETTPHDVALDYDNRREILEELSQMTDEPEEISAQGVSSGDIPDAQKPLEEQQEESGPVPPQSAGDSSEKAEESEKVQDNTKEPMNYLGQFFATGSKDSRQEKNGEADFSAVRILLLAGALFLAVVLLPAIRLFILVFLRQHWKKVWTANDWVSYQYRLLCRVFWLAGLPVKKGMDFSQCEEALGRLLSASGVEECREFLAIVERGTFGEGILGEELVRRAENACESILGEIYGRLTGIRRMVLRCWIGYRPARNGRGD